VPAFAIIAAAGACATCGPSVGRRIESTQTCGALLMSSDPVDSLLRTILESAIGQRAMPARLDDDTPLLGAIPELDSMAVLAMLTQVQDELGVAIADDEISAELFETFGALARFVRGKLAG
jgi:acyl carrier protein